MDGPTGPVTFRIVMQIGDGRVVATVSSDLTSDGTVPEINKVEKGIELRYTSELWGYSAPVVVTLIPLGDRLEATISIMRQFELSGIAVRQHHPAAARRPSR